jgi:hypothetical protein
MSARLPGLGSSRTDTAVGLGRVWLGAACGCIAAAVMLSPRLPVRILIATPIERVADRQLAGDVRHRPGVRLLLPQGGGAVDVPTLRDGAWTAGRR